MALRCVPAFSPPHLFLCHPTLHTRSFSAHLPKLQICSSLSRWFRAEMRKPPPLLPLAPPPSSGLNHNGDASHALYRPEGAAKRTLTANSGVPPASRAHRALNTAGAPTSTDKRLFSSMSVLLSWFSVFLEKKSCFRGQAGQSLPWGPGRGVGPFPTRKGKGGRGTDLMSAFAGHALCDFLQHHRPTPPL